MLNARVVSSDGLGRGTRVYGEDGGEIKGVEEVIIEPMHSQSVTRILLKLCFVAVEVTGQAHAHVIHPKTGKMTEVRSITFADGEKVEF